MVVRKEKKYKKEVKKMCEYLSFGVLKKGRLRILVGESTVSHSNMADVNKVKENSYYEAEWTKDDKGESLVVWTEDHDESEKYIKRILDEYTDRKKLEVEVWRKVAVTGGSLDLRDTNITSLPEGLKVGGYLDLQGIKIKSLPEGLKVGGKIYR